MEPEKSKPASPGNKTLPKRTGGALLSREFYRRGPAQRNDAAVSFLDIRRRFDFRSIEIGRWVTEPEKQRAAGLFHDALCDLMQILQGPESLISLRGTLGLQYGIGGRPGVAAHYIPASRTFALAKNAGPGSIAHEWFHAFDHYICGKAFAIQRPGVFASRAWLDNAKPVIHPLNERLQACFKAILLDVSGKVPSALFRDSAKRDEQLGTLYYSQPEELCARAFEAFVQDAAIKNAFLVKGTLATEEARLGLYPQGEQRARINHRLKFGPAMVFSLAKNPAERPAPAIDFSVTPSIHIPLLLLAHVNRTSLLVFLSPFGDLNG